VNLPAAEQQNLVSTSLIVCGILSAVQITRFHIRGTQSAPMFQLLQNNEADQA